MVVSDRLTLERAKRTHVRCLHGGKIAEQANDSGNAGYKLNSVMFYKVKPGVKPQNRGLATGSQDLGKITEGVKVEISNPRY